MIHPLIKEILKQRKSVKDMTQPEQEFVLSELQRSVGQVKDALRAYPELFEVYGRIVQELTPQPVDPDDITDNEYKPDPEGSKPNLFGPGLEHGRDQ